MSKTPLRLFFTAQSLMTLASSMLTVAVGWHLYERTGNPFDLALVGLMQILPIAGLFIVSGWVIDHVRRKYVLIACTVVQGCVFYGLAVTFAADEFSRVAVFSLLFLNGASRAFYGPGVQAALPGIVTMDYLSRAISMSSTIRNAGEAIGPFVAGLLIAWVDLGVYEIFAALAVLSGFFYLLLPSPAVRKPAGRGLQQLLDGIRFIVKNRYVFPAISIDLVLVLVGSVVVLLPVYAVDILNVGPEALGLMRAMPGVGAVAAGILMARVPAMRDVGRLLFISLAIFAASILVFAFSNNLWLSLLMLFVYGASDMVSVNVRMTIVQLGTPDELRGRVSAVNSFFIATSNDLGDFRAGAVATLIGPIAAVVTGGVMAVGVVAGSYFLFPTLRNLDRMSDASAEPQDSKDP